MRVAIVVRSGPTAGRRIQLKASQLARFGRSNWADFAFAEDSAMADIHFEIQCDSRSCHITSLAGDKPTLVNQQAVTNARLNSGDIIIAGQTQLAVDIHGGSDSVTVPVEAAAAVISVDPDATAKICEYIELSEPALLLAKSHPTPDSFEAVLIAQQLWADAIRWRAHRLPKPQAVAWGLACLTNARNNTSSVAIDEAACEAAAAWAQDPSEENRKKAAQQLEINGGTGLGGALVAAAAWSGGSLAPEGVDPVPPDERMTGHFVTTALTIMSHTIQSAGSATDRLKRYLQTSV